MAPRKCKLADALELDKRRWKLVMMVNTFKTANTWESCRRDSFSGVVGSRDGLARTGKRAAKETIRGTREFSRRYRFEDDGLIALNAREYNAALIPLKLTVRDKARARLFGKWRMQRMKHAVLNQQMLNPANEQQKNTYSCLKRSRSLSKQMLFLSTTLTNLYLNSIFQVRFLDLGEKRFLCLRFSLFFF